MKLFRDHDPKPASESRSGPPDFATESSSHRLKWQKAGEERTELILNSLRGLVAIIDHQGELLFANQAWRQAAHPRNNPFLVLPGEELSCLAYYSDLAQREETAAPFVEGLKAVLQGQADLFEMEYSVSECVTQSLYLLQVTPLPLEQGRAATISHVNISDCMYSHREKLAAETAAAQKEQHDREFNLLQQFSGSAPTPVTGQEYGTGAFRSGLPDLYQEIQKSYEELLDQALDQRMYRVEHNIDEGLRAIAETLGFAKAGPRDVIDLHTSVLAKKAGMGPYLRAQAYMEEGRMVVLELMGHLVAYYRNRSVDQKRVLVFDRNNHSEDQKQ